MVDREFTPEEECEADDGNHEQGDDEARSEPVLFLPLIKHDLNGADGDDEKAEAPVVDAFAALADLREVRWIFDEAIGENERNDADGDIQEEDPAPGVVIDDPTADRGAEDRRHYDGYPVDSKCHAAFLRRE